MINTIELSQLKKKVDGLLESCLLNHKYNCVLGFLEFQSKKNPLIVIDLKNHLLESIKNKLYSVENNYKILLEELSKEITNNQTYFNNLI